MLLITAGLVLFNGCGKNAPTPPKQIIIQKDNIVSMQEDFDEYIRDKFKETDEFITKTERKILLLNKKPKSDCFIYYK
jgi:hypothetical protein